MTETTTLMNLIVALLTPMLLSVTGGDRAQAREAATQAVSAYAARNSADDGSETCASADESGAALAFTLLGTFDGA